MKILIAYDGSHGADVALEDALRAGFPADADVLFLTVAGEAEASLVPHPEELVAAATGGGTRELQTEPPSNPALRRARSVNARALGWAREHAPRWRVHGHAALGSVASTIVLHADAWQPEVVVVGSRARARPLRLVLGSVARKVVTEARCSVRVARAPCSPAGSPVKVLVGHDGGHGGRLALRAAASRDWPDGSEILVLAVLETADVTVFASDVPWGMAWAESAPPRSRAGLLRRIEDDAQEVRRVGLAITPVLRTGEAVRTLLGAARRWKVDSVFVGATAMGRVERFLLGSVSSSVADRARCSVEVVR